MMVEKALKLCKKVHAKQTYIVDGEDVPYYNHCILVANIIEQYAEDELDKEFAKTVALLHDTLEDMPLTAGYIAKNFGERVADGVLALTKNDSLPYAERLDDSIARILALKSREVAAVKMADRICNLHEFSPSWSKEKIRAYIADAAKLNDALKWASPKLAALFTKAIENAKKLG